MFRGVRCEAGIPNAVSVAVRNEEATAEVLARRRTTSCAAWRGSRWLLEELARS